MGTGTAQPPPPQPTGAANQVQAVVTRIVAVGFRPPADAADAALYQGAVSGATVDATDTQGGQFVVPPNEEIQLIAILDGFAQPPSPAKFEIFASQPQDTGGSPAVPLTATATRTDMRASWTFDPTGRAQSSIHGTAWIRATAGTTVHIVQVRVADPSIHDLKWSLPGAGRRDPALTAANVGGSVVFSCAYSAHDAGTTPVVEIFDGADVVWDHAQVNSGATAVATLTITEASNNQRLTAPWTAALPASATSSSSSSGGRPMTLPRVFARVTIGSGDTARVALSAPLFVLPPLQVALEPGDPNWLMEPIVDPPGGVAHRALLGAHPDHEHDANANPDAAAAYPKRVLGIKQRLQALSYYYEALPSDDAGRNKQTRVFRKCFKWYWEHVDPADTSKPVPLIDAPASCYPPDAHGTPDPERGPKIVNLFPTDQQAKGDLEDWCRRLEDAVRAGVLRHEPPAHPGDIDRNFDDTIDFTTDTRMIFPGDFHFNNQEGLYPTPPHAGASDPIDYTFTRTSGPYSTYSGGLDDDPSSATDGDWRHRSEEITFARNKALGRVPIVAKVQMQINGNWVDGPDEGISVQFQLVPVRDDSATSPPPDPPYFSTLLLRPTSRIDPRRGAFPPAAASALKGPQGYLQQVHSHYWRGTPNVESDPTWWNAHAIVGGKRADVLTVAGTILSTGADARALFVPQVESFPWSATDTSSPTNHRAVAVPVVGGKAALVFAPSRRGGDTYKIRAYILSPTPPPGGGAPAELCTITTAPLTVWRRVRVTRHFRKGIPASWTADNLRYFGASETEADPSQPRFTEAVDWGKVGEIYRKAFIVLEAPSSPAELTMTMRDNALQGVVSIIKAVSPNTPASAHNPDGQITNYSQFMRRWGQSATLRRFDPDHFFRYGTDSPYLADINTPTDYDAAVGAGAAQAGDYPWNGFFTGDGPLRWLNDEGDFHALFGLFLDPNYSPSQWDPLHPETSEYDAVPFPGVTCVQAICGDNVTANQNIVERMTFLNTNRLRAAKPGAATSRADFLDGLGRAIGPEHWSTSGANPTKFITAYENENSDLFFTSTTWALPAPHDTSDPVPGTLGWLLDDIMTQLTTAGVSVDAGLVGSTGSNFTPNPFVNSEGKIVFEIKATSSAPATPPPPAPDPPSLSVEIGNMYAPGPHDAPLPHGVTAGQGLFQFTVTGDASSGFTATSTAIKTGGANVTGDTLLRNVDGFCSDSRRVTRIWFKGDATRRDLSGNPIRWTRRLHGSDDRGATVQDLADVYLTFGATSATVNAGQIVIQFPSIRNPTPPKTPSLLFSTNAVNFYPFAHEQVTDSSGKVFHRFTSHGSYWRIADDSPDPAHPVHTTHRNRFVRIDAEDPTTWDVDLSLILEGQDLAAGDTLTMRRMCIQDWRRILATTFVDGTADVTRSTFQLGSKNTELDFRYGAPPSGDGTTLANFLSFLARGTSKNALAANDGELDFEATHQLSSAAATLNVNNSGTSTLPTSTHAGAVWFFYREKQSLHTQRLVDGMSFSMVVKRGGQPRGTGIWPAFMNPRSPMNSPFTTSGIATQGRVFYVFYGGDIYNNAGPRNGPDPSSTTDPTGGRGAGFRLPNTMFIYPLPTNAAHELGHTLYLRHHWTGNNPGSVVEHDWDDICHMSYYSSYVELPDPNGGDPTIAEHVPLSDLIFGRNRDAGRSEACGRCLLKLRGWHMGQNSPQIPSNAGTFASRQNPSGFPTNIGDVKNL
jgi:hypothetical protein